MSETSRMWIEVIFNLTYLAVIWSLVIVMILRRGSVPAGKKRTADLFTLAFALLALGDTGHVGFRAVAYLIGDLSAVFRIGGHTLGLIGLGALATGFTVTIFYMLMLEIWHERFQKPHGILTAALLFAGLVRLGIMALPFNNWSSPVPVQPWSTLRNIPLIIQGLGVIFLFTREGIRNKDHTFLWIAFSIFISYLCYLPVILFVQQIPLLGMLMIPKTLAYLAVAWLAYRNLYPQPLLQR